LTGIGIDEVIARYVNGNNAATRTYLADALGSVIGLAKDDQAVATQYGYSPYGETAQTGEAIKNDSQYTARENDNTGLYYYRARYYDPVLKRFIAEDPIGLGGGINKWAYVGGDPISYTDPMGLYWFRQSWQARDPIVGRENTFVPPGGSVSSFIERYVPAGRTLGEIHDPLVAVLTRAGVPDLLANKPTMPSSYLAAIALEILRSLGIEKQPEQKLMCPR